jgi:phthalate 4,5-dioxygenase oxygenase subunit
MLTQEDNKIITQVGPGTPMGMYMREYWIPVCLSEELDSDGPSRRVKLLGEDLVAFRVTSGKVGLVQRNCPHRGAALYFGRNEEEGLTCVYHGWKFGVDGQCLDMPNEPDNNRFHEKVRAMAYPCEERNGLIWTYMGSREEPPPLPMFEWNSNPDNIPIMWRNHRACNYMQAMEGGLDTSHVGFLHRTLDKSLGSTSPGNSMPGGPRRTTSMLSIDSKPRLEVKEAEYGLLYTAKRSMGNNEEYHRIHPFLLPFHNMIGGGLGDGTGSDAYTGMVWVPMDDEQTLVLEWHYRPEKPYTAEEREKIVKNRNPHGFLPDNTLDPVGGWKLEANWDNFFHWDYELQRDKLFFGVTSNPLQDGAIQQSMEAIYDRSKEHLGTADAMIIRMRRSLLDAARTFAETGEAVGVDNPEIFANRPVGAVLPEGADWLTATEKRRDATDAIISNS